MEILERYLEPNDIFFDLGCNIGYVSLFVLKNINKEGFLYSIDPDFKNISALKKSIEINSLNNNYTIENIALSSEDGEIGLNSLKSQIYIKSIKNYLLIAHLIRRSNADHLILI